MSWILAPQISTYPACKRFLSVDGRLGEVRRAADITVGIAGRGGAATAVALEADIPALLRKGALEALGAQSDAASGVSTLRNQMGHYAPSVVAFGDGPPGRGRGPKLADPLSEWASVGKRSYLPNGGVH